MPGHTPVCYNRKKEGSPLLSDEELARLAAQAENVQNDFAFYLIVLSLGAFPGLFAQGSGEDASGIWLDVPLVRQEKYGCGSASISMVLQYWDRETGIRPAGRRDAGAIQKLLYRQDAKGILASDIERYFQEQGFRTFTFAGKWVDLKHHISKGRPLVVALREGGEGAPLHYAVVVGVNWEEDTILFNDPALRKLAKRDRAHFEKSWKAAGNWALLAIPRGDNS
ncbi:MAG: C39 family peptidase [Acidobacteriota bacterium]